MSDAVPAKDATPIKSEPPISPADVIQAVLSSALDSAVKYSENLTQDIAARNYIETVSKGIAWVGAGHRHAADKINIA